VIITGLFWVKVNNNEGCEGRDTIIISIWPKGPVSKTEKLLIKVFPNPSHKLLNIVTEDNINKLKVINLAGQEIFSSTKFGNKIILNTLDWPEGIYILKTDINGSFYFQKLSILHN